MDSDYLSVCKPIFLFLLVLFKKTTVAIRILQFPAFEIVCAMNQLQVLATVL